MGEQAPRAFLRIGTAEVWAQGEDRFTVKAPGQEEVVVGFEEARQRARELAEQLA